MLSGRGAGCPERDPTQSWSAIRHRSRPPSRGRDVPRGSSDPGPWSPGIRLGCHIETRANPREEAPASGMSPAPEVNDATGSLPIEGPRDVPRRDDDVLLLVPADRARGAEP